MVGSIRKYRVRQGDAGDLSARVRQGLVPLLEKAPGFLGYYVLDSNDGFVTSVTICDSRADAEAITNIALDWVKRNLPDMLTDPVVTIGELTISLTRQPA
jgi:heme-degrading monooxygenase HmoA